MSNEIYYLETGKCLKGDEAVKYVNQLEKEYKDLYNKTKKELEYALSEMKEFKINDGKDYITQYENIMNIGELLSRISIYLEPIVLELEDF